MTFIVRGKSRKNLNLVSSDIVNSEIAGNAVETSKIKDLNVTAGKLAATLDLSGKTVTLAAKEVGAGEIGLTSGAMLRGAAGDAAEELVKGTPNQMMAMDGGGGFPGWYTVGGDLSQAAGTFTVQGLGATVSASANKGVPGANVTATERGDSYNHVTRLTFTNLALPGPTAMANEAHGYLLYTFPAGTHIHKATLMGIGLQGGGVVNADTPDVGLGSVEATGAVALLNGTATFEDYITGQTAADCNGTLSTALLAATAGALTGISLNDPTSAKTLYLNYADGWAGADTLLATGQVIIEWTTLPLA